MGTEVNEVASSLNIQKQQLKALLTQKATKFKGKSQSSSRCNTELQ